MGGILWRRSNTLYSLWPSPLHLSPPPSSFRPIFFYSFLITDVPISPYLFVSLHLSLLFICLFWPHHSFIFVINLHFFPFHPYLCVPSSFPPPFFILIFSSRPVVYPLFVHFFPALPYSVFALCFSNIHSVPTGLYFSVLAILRHFIILFLPSLTTNFFFYLLLAIL